MNKLVLVAGIALAAAAAYAQPPQGPPPGPAPTGLVVGSGNFFSPIVANLDEAVVFYRDGIGFAFEGEPGNADANPQLRQMFGLPDARLRWHTGRVPRVQGGVEIVEISSAGGKRIEQQMQDPGVLMLMVVVRDIDGTLARLKQLGAPVVTRGGEPVTVGGPGGGVRAVVVRDPAGHFVELVQPARLPPTLVPENIVGVRLRHTVANLDSAAALYRDALGLRAGNVPAEYYNEPSVLELLGVPTDTLWRFTLFGVPTSGLQMEIMEFKGARAPQPMDIADPGATRIQLRVSDVDAAIAQLTKAGGTVVSTGGKALDLPAGDQTLRVAMVRDPDNLFLVLIESPPAP